MYENPAARSGPRWRPGAISPLCQLLSDVLHISFLACKQKDFNLFFRSLNAFSLLFEDAVSALEEYPSTEQVAQFRETGHAAVKKLEYRLLGFDPDPGDLFECKVTLAEMHEWLDRLTHKLN